MHTEEQSNDFVSGVECARILHVLRPNFFRDHASKPDFPPPVAELATGRIWRRSDVEAYARDYFRRRKEQHAEAVRARKAKRRKAS